VIWNRVFADARKGMVGMIVQLHQHALTRALDTVCAFLAQKCASATTGGHLTTPSSIIVLGICWGARTIVHTKVIVSISNAFVMMDTVAQTVLRVHSV